MIGTTMAGTRAKTIAVMIIVMAGRANPGQTSPARGVIEPLVLHVATAGLSGGFAFRSLKL
jgi:hypothetical protein